MPFLSPSSLNQPLQPIELFSSYTLNLFNMDQIIIDFLYYPHEQNIPCDEFVAAQGRWLDEEEYEWLD